jgi:DNA-directed RNA polymerase subunit RPC12/RpoP
MQPLDGNAIAGQLFDVFGVEMTTASGTCSHCGATAQIAELMVYMRAPGSVVRCPVCGSVLIVLAEVRGTTRAHFSGFTLRDPPSGGY